MSKLSKSEESEENINVKVRNVITQEMKTEFWKHDLNPITGWPVPKYSNQQQFGEEFSVKGNGVRYADSAGYQSSASR